MNIVKQINTSDDNKRILEKLLKQGELYDTLKEQGKTKYKDRTIHDLRTQVKDAIILKTVKHYTGSNLVVVFDEIADILKKQFPEVKRSTISSRYYYLIKKQAYINEARLIDSSAPEDLVIYPDKVKRISSAVQDKNHELGEDVRKLIEEKYPDITVRRFAEKVKETKNKEAQAELIYSVMKGLTKEAILKLIGKFL